MFFRISKRFKQITKLICLNVFLSVKIVILLCFYIKDLHCVFLFITHRRTFYLSFQKKTQKDKNEINSNSVAVM